MIATNRQKRNTRIDLQSGKSNPLEFVQRDRNLVMLTNVICTNQNASLKMRCKKFELTALIKKIIYTVRMILLLKHVIQFLRDEQSNPSSCGINSTRTVLLQGGLCH